MDHGGFSRSSLASPQRPGASVYASDGRYWFHRDAPPATPIKFSTTKETGEGNPMAHPCTSRDRALFLAGITAYALWKNGEQVIGPTKLKINQVRAEIDLGMYDQDIRAALKGHILLDRYVNPVIPPDKPEGAPVVWNQTAYITENHIRSSGKMNNWVIRHMANQLGVNNTGIRTLMRSYGIEIPEEKLTAKKKKNGAKSTTKKRPPNSRSKNGPIGFPHAAQHSIGG